MNLPTVDGTRARVTVWSQLEDRQPAYALVSNVDLVVIRFDHRVAVLYGRCHHRGALLADGYIDGQNLICGVHGWDYRYDTGVSEYNNDEALHRFAAVIDQEADAVWVDEAEVAEFAEAHPQPYRRDEYLGLYQDVHGGPEEPHNNYIQGLARDGDAGKRDLECHATVERALDGLVDHAHAAAGDLAHDLEIAQDGFFRRDGDAGIERRRWIGRVGRSLHEGHHLDQLPNLVGQLRILRGQSLDVGRFAPAHLLQD